MTRTPMTRGLSGLFALLAVGMASCGPETSLVPVSELEVKRYLGTWYDVASFPQTFQEGCHCTTATYELRNDGDISVLNRCRKDAVDGEKSEATARAYIPDPAEPGKLKVEFFWPFAADYWVVDLGDEAAEPYSHAVVSEPGQQYLWILSRTSAMDQQVYDAILERLGDVGFALDRLDKTPQQGCWD